MFLCGYYQNQLNYTFKGTKKIKNSSSIIFIGLLDFISSLPNMTMGNFLFKNYYRRIDNNYKFTPQIKTKIFLCPNKGVQPTNQVFPYKSKRMCFYISLSNLLVNGKKDD